MNERKRSSRWMYVQGMRWCSRCDTQRVSAFCPKCQIMTRARPTHPKTGKRDDVPRY